MLERAITDKIIERLKKEPNCFVRKIHGGAYQSAGLPDIIACKDGKFIGLEVKRPGGKATTLQKVTLKAIESSGGICGIVYSVEDVEKILELM
jgi:Holliday junction resolvase